MTSAQYLIEGWGPPASRSTTEQLCDMQQCCRELARDSRVRVLYGVPSGSLGFAAVVAAESEEEASRIAAGARLSGFTTVRVSPLLSAEEFDTGLSEIQRRTQSERERLTALSERRAS